MKPTFSSAVMAALVGTMLAATISPARAGHVYAGLIDTNGTAGIQAGDALSFINKTTDAVVTGASQGLQLMSLVSIGDQAGLYMNNGITFTAAANGGNGTVWDGAAAVVASPYAALTGSNIQLQIASVTGPTGAHFSFWDGGSTSPTSTYTIGSGFTLGTGNFMLTYDGSSYAFAGQATETVGNNYATSVINGSSPPLDPFGHIHGRSFTTDMVGDYTVSYILHDLSGIAADSSPFVVAYAAPEPGRAMLMTAGCALLVLRRRRA